MRRVAWGGLRALSIKSPEADERARELAREMGESLTKAVTQALRERLLRVRGRADTRPVAERLRQMCERCRRLPVLDDREPDEVLGYDEHGLPR